MAIFASGDCVSRAFLGGLNATKYFTNRYSAFLSMIRRKRAPTRVKIGLLIYQKVLPALTHKHGYVC